MTDSAEPAASSATGPSPRDPLHALDARLVSRMQQLLAETLAGHRVALTAIAPESATLVDALTEFLDGGKLLRPRFCFWAGTATLGRAPSETELDALARHGAAIELVQAAALLHDDVIDHSPTRRGRPAVHVAAARRHAEQELSGDSEDFGVAVAIVLGDLALSWAEELVGASSAEAATDQGAARRARGEFDRLRTEVMSGQFLDILHQAGGFESPADPEAAALAVIRWKTVPYSVLRPLRMGAALMGADDDQLELLSQWAIEVGTAFQLRDDMLSVIGDAEATGKPIGGDITEGKRTVLLARTSAAADDAQRALLAQTIGDPDAPVADVTAVRELMVSSGAVASVAQEVRDRAGRAQQLLEAAETFGTLGRSGLDLLADSATELESLRL